VGAGALVRGRGLQALLGHGKKALQALGIIVKVNGEIMGIFWTYIYMYMIYYICIYVYIYIRNTPGMDGDLMKISWRPAPECANGNILSMVQTMD